MVVYTVFSELRRVSGAEVMKNYYELLGITPNATQAEIRRAYLARMRSAHPDRVAGPDDPERWNEANRYAAALNEAYTILRSEKTRAKYDRDSGIGEFSRTDNRSGATARPCEGESNARESYSILEQMKAGCVHFRNLPLAVQERLKMRESGGAKNQIRIAMREVRANIAGATLIVLAWLGFLFLQTSAPTWEQGDFHIYLLSSIVPAILLAHNISKIAQWSKCALHNSFFITPLYVIDVEFDWIRYWPIWKVEAFTAQHVHTNGDYSHTNVTANLGSETRCWQFNRLQDYDEALTALQRYRDSIGNNLAKGDVEYFSGENDFMGLNCEEPQKKPFGEMLITYGAVICCMLLSVDIAADINRSGEADRWHYHETPSRANTGNTKVAAGAYSHSPENGRNGSATDSVGLTNEAIPTGTTSQSPVASTQTIEPRPLSGELEATQSGGNTRFDASKAPDANAVSWMGGSEADEQERVKEIQSILRDLGFQPGPTDGQYGPKTAEAIKRFQEENGMPQDGVPSATLLNTLHQSKATTSAAEADTRRATNIVNNSDSVAHKLFRIEFYSGLVQNADTVYERGDFYQIQDGRRVYSVRKDLVKAIHEYDYVPSEPTSNSAPSRPTEPTEPSTAPPQPQPIPANGTVVRYTDAPAVAPLEIVTRGGQGHYYVKLTVPGRKDPVISVFVRSGERAEIEVPLGTFELKYATGESWFGENYLFGEWTRYSKANDLFHFRKEGNDEFGYDYLGYTIELYLQTDGNLETQDMRPQDF